MLVCPLKKNQYRFCIQTAWIGAIKQPPWGSRPGSGSLRPIPCGDPLKSHMSRGHLTARFHFATFTLRWKTPKSHWLSFPDSSLTFIYLFFTQFTISLCAVSFGHPRVLRVMPHLPYTGSDSREVDRERKTKMEGVCPSNQVVFFKKLTKQNAGQCIYFINYSPKNSILKKGCYCQYYPHLIFIIIPTFEQVSSNTKQWKWVQIESSQFASHCLL